MTPSSLFEITRRHPGINASAKYAAEAPRGLALGAHGTDPDSFSPADHNTFIGHLTRVVRTGGVTLTDIVFGTTSATPIGVELPFKAGEEVSVEKALEIECEGTDYLWTSGTGALSSSTTVPQNLSFYRGRLRASQTGELVNYTLTAINLTPNTSGGLRIRAEARQ